MVPKGDVWRWSVEIGPDEAARKSLSDHASLALGKRRLHPLDGIRLHLEAMINMSFICSTTFRTRNCLLEGPRDKFGNRG